MVHPGVIDAVRHAMSIFELLLLLLQRIQAKAISSEKIFTHWFYLYPSFIHGEKKSGLDLLSVAKHGVQFLARQPSPLLMPRSNEVSRIFRKYRLKTR